MKAVFIVGTGRSGTTVIYDRLAGAINAATIPALGGRYPMVLNPSVIANRLGMNKWIFRPSSEAMTLLARCGLSAERTHELRQAFKQNDISEKEKSQLYKYLATVSYLSRRETVIVKNTGNTLRIAAINSALPESRFVYVVRDPRAVVSSLMKVGFWPSMRLWWCGQTPSERQAAGEASEVTAAFHWLHQVEAAEVGLRQVAAERVHRIFYEGFAIRPEGTLRDLSKSLGCSASLSGESLSGIDSSRMSQWKDMLSPLQIANIEKVVGDAMTNYDYQRC